MDSAIHIGGGGSEPTDPAVLAGAIATVLTAGYESRAEQATIRIALEVLERGSVVATGTTISGCSFVGDQPPPSPVAFDPDYADHPDYAEWVNEKRKSSVPPAEDLGE